MEWIVFAVLSAFFHSLSDFFTKRFGEDTGTVENAFLQNLFSLPVLWGIALYHGMPVIGGSFWPAIAVGVPVEVIALLMYIKAIKTSPFSRTVPFLAFTPVFLLVVAPIILGEVAPAHGVLGVCVIVAGTYVINMRKGEGMLSPFRTIIHERGSLIMIAVAFLYSITSSFGKRAVLASSASFFAAVAYSLVTLALFTILIARGRLRGIFDFRVAIVGCCAALSLIFYVTALKMTLVSYLISVKRTSILFAIAYGVIFFGEKNLLRSIIGGVIAVAGVVILAIWK
jgi:drug/metabolite transporter (DMT)-like permease